MKTFILYVALVLYILYITRIHNMWGTSKGTKKAKADVRVERAKLRAKKKMQKRLAFFENFDALVGGRLNPVKEADLVYKIERIRWEIKSLGRAPKPSELNGFFKLMQLIGVSVGLTGFFMFSYNPLFLVVLTLATTPALFHAVAINKISAEDADIERDFPDLFLVLYSRLVQGSDAKISPVLKEFLISLDSTKKTDRSKDAIRHFITDLSNNIEIYGDDTIAIRKLREKYRSVMVINFANLAIQAINGVDNRDKLLTFKNELNQRKIEYMRARADKMVRRGSIAVWAIYLILAQFVILSWYAKFTQTQ